MVVCHETAIASTLERGIAAKQQEFDGMELMGHLGGENLAALWAWVESLALSPTAIRSRYAPNRSVKGFGIASNLQSIVKGRVRLVRVGMTAIFISDVKPSSLSAVSQLWFRRQPEKWHRQTRPTTRYDHEDCGW